MVEATQNPQGAEDWKAPGGEKYKPKLVLLEGDELPELETNSVLEEPAGVIKNRDIAHGAAITENESRENQLMREARGLDNRSLIETRATIEAVTSAQDKAASLIAEVIFDKMTLQADHANKDRHFSSHVRPEGRDLIQPERISTMLQDDSYRRDYESRFPEESEAAKSILGNVELSKLARTEGISNYYEMMTGVSATDMRAAFRKAEEALQAVGRVAFDEEMKWAVRNPLREKGRELTIRIGELQKVKELSTNLPQSSKPKYTVPGVFAPTDSFVKYYIGGVPEGTMSAQEFLAEARRIEAEALDALETSKQSAEEDPVSQPEVSPDPTDDKKNLGREKQKPSFLARVFGPSPDRPPRPVTRDRGPKRPRKPLR